MKEEHSRREKQLCREPGAQKREQLSKQRPKGDRGTSAFGQRHSPLFFVGSPEKSPSTPSPMEGRGAKDILLALKLSLTLPNAGGSFCFNPWN